MIGIYCITNTVNGKKYIGQSRNIHKRFIDHKNSRLKTHLYRSIKKYGIGNFDFSIIKIISNSKLSDILLDCYEKYYIKQYNTCDANYGYNKQAGGYGGMPTDETKSKQSVSAKRYWQSMPIGKRKERAKTNRGKTGYCEPYQTKVKKRQSHLGKTMSQETKNKIAQSKIGKKRDPAILKKSWQTRKSRRENA